MMESQLGSFGLGPGDNKGILSLLTAIEQSEDHFDSGQQAFRYRYLSDDYRLNAYLGTPFVELSLDPHRFADEKPKNV